MRRDYFTCVFLLYVAVSLAFVCFLPSYFVYGSIITRQIGLVERIASIIVAISAIVIIPIVSAFKKKLWITLGASAYGILAYLPEMLISKMDSVLAGENASTLGVVQEFILKAIYQMVNAPYVGISKLIGDKNALLLPKLILPVSIISYILVQLFRFYHQAYIAEQMFPVADATHKVEKPNTAARKPEILGTVISAPVTPKTNANTSTTGASSQTQVHQTVNSNPIKSNPSQNPNPAPRKPVVPQQTPNAVEGRKEDIKSVGAGNRAGQAQLDPGENNKLLDDGQKVIYVEAKPNPAKTGNETRVINLGAPVTPVVPVVPKPQAPVTAAPVTPANEVNRPYSQPVNQAKPVAPSKSDSSVIQLGAPNPDNSNSHN